MRQRNWLFYKIILYLGLAAAITVFSVFCFIAFYRYIGYWKDVTVQLVGLGILLQIIFYLLCIRLVHYYVPHRSAPGRSFSIIYTLLLSINGCMAAGLLLILAWAFSGNFLGRHRPSIEDYNTLFIIGSYTFIAIYLSAASIVLRRYNRYQVMTDEEKWLNELGNSSSGS